MKEIVQGTSDKTKWEMTVNIITRFLETLSEEDAIQIIGFKMVPEVLMGQETTVPATKRTVEQLKRRLGRLKPDGVKSVVDIGKAIDRAMNLLYANTNPGITKCENVSHCHLSIFLEITAVV